MNTDTNKKSLPASEIFQEVEKTAEPIPRSRHGYIPGNHFYLGLVWKRIKSKFRIQSSIGRAVNKKAKGEKRTFNKPQEVIHSVNYKSYLTKKRESR